MPQKKTCSICKQSRPAKVFRKWSRWCQPCINARQRASRAANKNRDTKKYEKSPHGFLMRAYRNMKSRTGGVQWHKAHLYHGLELLPKQEFYDWAWDNKEFWRLYRQWVAAGYDRKLTPSINRIDSTVGYVIGNIEWLTHSVNSSLGAGSLRRKENQALKEVFDHVRA